MLPFYVNHLSSYLKPYARMVHLTSSEPYGEIDPDDDHMLRRLNGFVDNLKNPEPYQMVDNMVQSAPMPSLNSPKVESESNRPSDILLSDTLSLIHI
jgi:hypothetical protein